MKKSKLIKKICCLLLAGVMVLALVACGDNSTADNNSNKLTEVSLGTTPWPTNMFFYLAQEKGIFEENGLKVTIEDFSSTTESTNAFVGGKIDFCTFASSETISPYAEGGDFSVVLATDKSKGCDGLVATSDIKSIKDLKGKTVATQLYSVDHMLLLTLLEENGMSADDIQIADMKIVEAGNAFIAGQCDAACIWDPYLSQAFAAGGTMLSTTADNPDLVTDCLAASNSLCKDNPEVITAMIKSFFEAIEYWENNQEETNAFMGEKLGVDAEEFANEMERIGVNKLEDALVAFTEAEDYCYWGYTQNQISGFMKDLGILNKDIDCGDMIDDSFVKSLAD